MIYREPPPQAGTGHPNLFIYMESLKQDHLPEPREPVPDYGCYGDAELFQNLFQDGLGDVWNDVTWIYLFNLVHGWKHLRSRSMRSQNNLVSVLPTQAEIPARLQYLAGRKYFKPSGRWVPASMENMSQTSRYLVIVLRSKFSKTWTSSI